jgi:hypothetical protein
LEYNEQKHDLVLLHMKQHQQAKVRHMDPIKKCFIKFFFFFKFLKPLFELLVNLLNIFLQLLIQQQILLVVQHEYVPNQDPKLQVEKLLVKVVFVVVIVVEKKEDDK